MSSRSLLAMTAALALIACSGNKMADLEEYVREVKQRPPGPIEPLPEIKQVDTYVFAPPSDRDPFALDRQSVEATATRPSDGITPDPLRRKEELEQYPLDSLSMVGTLEQQGSVWALVATPDKTLHHVRVGNYMGTNNGQITRITEEEIDLTEIVSDGGGWQERQASVALSQ